MIEFLIGTNICLVGTDTIVSVLATNIYLVGASTIVPITEAIILSVLHTTTIYQWDLCFTA